MSIENSKNVPVPNCSPKLTNPNVKPHQPANVERANIVQLNGAARHQQANQASQGKSFDPSRVRVLPPIGYYCGQPLNFNFFDHRDRLLSTMSGQSR